MKRSLSLVRRTTLYVTFLVPFVPPAAIAQSASTDDRVAQRALSGIVRDSTGAIIPRATITIRSEPAGLTRVIPGNPDGTFSIDQTAAGRYSVTASAAGLSQSRA